MPGVVPLAFVSVPLPDQFCSEKLWPPVVSVRLALTMPLSVRLWPLSSRTSWVLLSVKSAGPASTTVPAVSLRVPMCDQPLTSKVVLLPLS